MTKQHFETLALHAGMDAAAHGGSCQMPIYQTASYVFEDSAHAADLFALKKMGNSYSRLTNPTVSALQDRIAALHGGVGCVAAASGLAGQMLALSNLMASGDHLVASHRLYGGTVSTLKNTYRQFGWTTSFVDVSDLGAVQKAITPQTKAIYAESLANPGGSITDIEALANLAHKNGLPLVIDNTMASPYLMRPFDFGADIVCESTTKFLAGNGTAVGGAVIDSGHFDWTQNDKFPLLNGPEPAYNGMNFCKEFGKMAFTVRGIAVGLRDIGACQSPMNAFLTLNGIETLALRMERHVQNARIIAEWLSQHPDVSWVGYAGLPSSPQAALAKKYFPKGPGSIFTFGLKGGYEAGRALVQNVKMARHVANIGDTRTLVIHPSSTTHSQLSEEHQIAAGTGPDVVRISVGIEHPDDIKADLDQAIQAGKKAKAA
jgi:O-acetylhomoserine (thiol)-lyase